jgi:hypothetical protein
MPQFEIRNVKWWERFGASWDDFPARAQGQLGRAAWAELASTLARPATNYTRKSSFASNLEYLEVISVFYTGRVFPLRVAEAG